MLRIDALLLVAAAMRIALVMVMTGFGSVCHAQALWTLGPNVGGGIAWSDGQVHVGDHAPSHTPAYVPDKVAPQFALGVIATRRLVRRWSWSIGAALLLGPTQRLFSDAPPPRVYALVRTDEVVVYEMKLRAGARLTTSVRASLGARNRGYVGLGAGVGWSAETVRYQIGSLPTTVDPDPLVTRTSPRWQGATAEALLEGGVTFDAPRHLSLVVVVAAGRPLMRAEVVLAFPFEVGTR